MLKARSKKLSMLLVLAMIMTMFAGLGVASAADMYSVSSVPTISDGDTKRLGTIVVNANSIIGGNDAGFLVKLPDDFKIVSVNGKDIADKVGNSAYKGEYITHFSASKVEPNSVTADVYVMGTYQDNRIAIAVKGTGDIDELRFNLSLEANVPAGASSEVMAVIAAQPTSYVFNDAALVVARTGAGSIEVMANDPVSFSSGTTAITASVRVNDEDAFDKISFKLPAGFKWSGDVKLLATGSYAYATVTDEDRKAEFKSVTPKVYKAIYTLAGAIEVDETRAKYGDVVVTLGGANVKPGSITIGSYNDYGVELEASDAPTVLAGRTELEAANIKVKELAAGSLVKDRTVLLTLPSGVRWVEGEKGKVKTEETTKVNAVTVSETTILKSDVAKVVIDTESNKKGWFEIQKPQIEVAPDFVGDVVVSVSGSAGATGELKIAEVVAPVTVEANLVDVKIGLQAQAGGNIVITETEAEAVMSSVYNEESKATNKYEPARIILKAPMSVQWAKVPTVKVIDGDLEIDTVKRDKDNRELHLIIKSTSTKDAAKIEISDVAWTVDRTVPEGAMRVTVAGDALVETEFTNRTTVTSFVAANVVTPAPGETLGAGEFVIGSNFYYVGGVKKLMDVAPYIKDSRTYVPMRFLGEILGAEVVWDDAARTVTLTRGDDVVVFTVGSESYTINGDPKTADVAPEIVNERTMLPARFVAEGFGALVGWDPGTQTVLIQN